MHGRLIVGSCCVTKIAVHISAASIQTQWFVPMPRTQRSAVDAAAVSLGFLMIMVLDQVSSQNFHSIVEEWRSIVQPIVQPVD